VNSLDTSKGTQGLPSLPKHWQIQSKLPCASICGFSLPPKLKSSLCEVSGNISVLDLFLHLRGDSTDAELTRVLNTEFKEKQAKRAYLKLYENLLHSRRTGRPISDKLAWIVPDRFLDKKSRLIEEHTSEIEEYLSSSLGRQWRSVQESYGDWLPYISLGVANLIRRWRSPRINSLRRAMFRLAKDFDPGNDSTFPWERGFNNNIRRIPIQSLYQYEPNNLTAEAVKRLNELGFIVINDLRCLHPDAVHTISNRVGRETLFALYRHLQD